MFIAQIVEMDDAIVVQCKGRLVRSDAAYQLRNLIQSNRAQNIILDFSELDAIEGGGLGMLGFLQRWTAENGITLRILRPTTRVDRKLKEFELSGVCKFEIERESDVMTLVGFPDRQHWVVHNLAA